MKLTRDLSGAALMRVLCRDFGDALVHQVGSHLILQTETPRHRRLAIPNYSPLRIGTLNSILRAVAEAKNVTKEEVLNRL